MFRSLSSTLLAIALTMTGAAQAAMTFEASMASRTEPAKGASNAARDETRTYQVVLGERYMTVTQGQDQDIYDFATRRRYRVDLAAKRYSEYSLYDRAGFNTLELANRDGLGRALAAAKIDNNGFDPVYAEHSLAVPGKTARTLAEAAEGEAALLSIDGKPLARVAAGGSAIDARDAAAFTRFLRYQVGGHPLLLNHIAGLRRVPASMSMYHLTAGGKQTHEIRIGGVAAGAPPAYDLSAYQRYDAQDSEIDQVLARARPLGADAQQRHEAEIDQAFAEKRALDALLGTLEWGLMSGAQMQPFSAERRAMLSADEGVRTVLGALNPAEQSALPAAAAALAGARQLTMRKQHMLKLFEANHRAKMGERKAALALFASVLRMNPSLAGAYKDMGDVLYMSFDAARAWRSWDAGRRIAPGLDLFAPVNQLEQSLAREHPGFF